jgi:hypothetical protein
VANAYAYRYYLLAPRAGTRPEDAARAATSKPELYWEVTGRAHSADAARDRASDDGIVVFARDRTMAMSRARDRLRQQYAAQARALALADLDAGTMKPHVAAICQAIGIPAWAVGPALVDVIAGAYYNTLQERDRETQAMTSQPPQLARQSSVTEDRKR